MIDTEIIARARTARDAAAQAEWRALAAFVDAQEARFRAQEDLEDLLAPVDLFEPLSEMSAAEADAEAAAHEEAVAVLDELEAADVLLAACEVTEAAEDRLLDLAIAVFSATDRSEDLQIRLAAAQRDADAAVAAEAVATEALARAQDRRALVAA